MAEDESVNPERLAIGVIVAPHGNRGEVRMQVWTHFPEHIQDLKTVYIGDDERPRRLRGVRTSRGLPVLSLQGITSREAADELRGAVVRIARDQAAPLEEDEFYHFELIGMDVFTEDGQRIGSLTDIIETGANDVYVVNDDEGKEHLFPALHDVVPDIDREARRITVRPLNYWES